MTRVTLLTLLCIAFLYSAGLSQGPYELNWKKELPYIGTAIGSTGFGAYMRTLPPLFTPNELLTLDPQDINFFDRIATGQLSEHADQVSDYFWVGSHAAPLLFLNGKKSRAHFGQIMTMYGEVAIINLGLTVIAKSGFRRPRPYVFNSNASIKLRTSKNAKASFVSGHASMTAVNTFFAAQVFSDFYPDSDWKPVVWWFAATIPAVTAYLRIAAGRHYPTDVLAGYALGASIGMLIPRWHRRALKKWGAASGKAIGDVQLSPTPAGFYLCWIF